MHRPTCSQLGKTSILAILLALLASCGGGNGRSPTPSATGSPAGTTAQEGKSKPAAVTGQTLDTHAVSIDADGKLLSWVTPQDKAFDRVSFLSWDLLLNRVPVDPSNGLKVYFTHSEYDPDNFSGSGWPNNPAGKNAMLAESAALYYAYSGNRGVIDLVSSLLTHQLEYGTTPAAYVWGNVPWSTAQAGSVTYGNDAIREGAGVLEPDKLGELGFHGYLRFWQITGDLRYRDAAIACADALVKNMRPGNATQSPWPYRVRAQDGQVVEEYTAHVIAPIRLFDELIRLNLGNVAGYSSARQAAWDWLIAYPMVNGRWTQYFEDVPKSTDQFWNLNQYAPGQTARYLLENPDKDPNWQSKVAELINFIETNFGGDQYGDPGLYLGARVISEQYAYMYKMASHTSRFGAVNALYARATGDAAAKDKAFRSLNWATYMARDNGGVAEGPAEFVANRPFWFTDGHGDYVRHFMIAMGAFPEWAPASENHLLRSSSMVKLVSYTTGAIDYQTYDSASTEVFRVGSAPVSVTADGLALPLRTDLGAPGWTFDSAFGVLTVRHDAATQIRVAFDGAQAPPMIGALSPADGGSAVAANSMVTVTFNQAMDASTINESTFVLRNSAGTAIAATVSYNPTTLTATLTPSTALAGSTTYTATLTGGASGVKDSAGNPLAVNRTWSFTTASAGSQPSSIWPASAAPTEVDDGDPASTNVGTKFRSDLNGFITAIRFYKAPANTGTHIGALWTAAGQQLATVTFTNETASGWQQANLSAPVAITANTVYVVSYLAPKGHYTGEDYYFATAGIDSPPLHALRDGESGPNGMYVYGAGLAFPTQTYRSESYWVDVVFTTSIADTTAPTVSATTPSNGATGVTTASAVTATFSEALDAATIGGATFELLNTATNTAVSANVGYNAATRVATLTPTSPLAPGAVYTANVRGGSTEPRVKDSAGNALVSSVSWSFTTAAVDLTAPTVTSTSPLDGVIGVSGTANVTASFSEALDPTSINGTTFELRDAGGMQVGAAVTYDAASRVATLNPTPTLSAGAAYTATIKGATAGVKDVAGNPLASNFTWSFTIATDTTAPTVTAVTPGSGATGVATGSAVTATFSEAMNAGTINATTFVLSSGAGQVAANVSYDTATRVATLGPSSALASGTLFTATLIGGANGVKDSAGNALDANRVWTFTTTGTDLTPPTVVPTSPTNGATGVLGTANVIATFNEAMDATTINSTTFELRDANNNVVAAAVTYSATTRVVTLNPTPTLAPSTTYSATLKGGGTDPRVKDTAGNALAANVTWSFTIVPDTIPPTVSSTSPASGATGTSATANVTATFNEAMDASTISETTFELRDPANNLLPRVVSYNATNRRATLDPTVNLVAGTAYTAIVRAGPAGVKDSAGNPLAIDRVWTFTIETTPPTVTSASPANATTGVSRTANITATFSEVVAVATVTAANFELRDPSGTPVAPTSLTLSTNGRTVTLNPEPRLAPLTTYTLVIKGGASGVTDLAGNPLAGDVSRTFTTRQ